MTGRTIDRIYPELPPVPEDAPVALEVRDLASHGRERLLARAAPGRDPRHRRPRRPGPARALHDPVRRAEGDRRRDPRRREAQADPRPADAIRAGLGIALVPEDRKSEGLLLPMYVRDNLTLAILPRISAAGVLRRRDRVEARLADRRAPPDPDTAAERPGGGHALGRQPAEGADRPLAARRAAT